MRRVVVTGIGIISSIGNNVKEVLNSLKSGKSGITFSQKLKDLGMRSHIWGNIKLDTTGLIDRKIERFMSDASIYAYLAMEQAIIDAKLTQITVSNERTGIIVGSGAGSPHNQVLGSDNMRKRGLRGVGPYMVTKSMASGISACLASAFKIKGVNYSISSACATSAHCIGNAMEIIQLGKQDIIFSGGGEEISWEMACEFDAMGALSKKYNHIPEKSSRVYDINRDGFVISGGAGILVLEELQHALSRGVYIYGELIGYGATSDGESIVVPSGEGAIRCMRQALVDIKDISIIDYINVHGTSTVVGDIIELQSIKKVFNSIIPFISSTKSITGHALGAAGVHEMIFSLLMLKHNFIAPSINIERLDPLAINMNIVTDCIYKKLNIIISNSFGFGGTNVSLVIKKYY